MSEDEVMKQEFLQQLEELKRVLDERERENQLLRQEVFENRKVKNNYVVQNKSCYFCLKYKDRFCTYLKGYVSRFGICDQFFSQAQAKQEQEILKNLKKE